MFANEGERRRAVRAWCLYDWANSAFATTVMAAMYPPFFRQLAVSAGVEPHLATSYWGYISALALAIVGLTGPVLGAIADHAGSRKRFLVGFAATGMAATAAAAFTGGGSWQLAAALFVVGSIGFAGGNVFYESLLPRLVPTADLDRVSSWGYAIGYLGGGLLLLLNAAWVVRPELFGFSGPGDAVRASFLSVAVWWGTFTVPLLTRVPEPPGAPLGDLPVNPVRAGFRRLRRTFAHVRRYRQLFLFLGAFWLYNDGIGTIIKMATAYGDELGIGMGHLVGALVLTQFVGFPCALLFGRLAGVVGAKRGILAALAVYAGISVMAYFMTSAWQFWLLAGLVGTVQGGAQALSRSLFAAMVPGHESAEFFGFYSTSGKLAGIFGPLLVGLVGQLTGSSRLGIVAVVVFFVGGALLLLRVDEHEGAAVARRAERDAGYAPVSTDVAR